MPASISNLPQWTPQSASSAMLPAEDWPATGPGCFRSEAFAEDLSDSALAVPRAAGGASRWHIGLGLVPLLVVMVALALGLLGH